MAKAKNKILMISKDNVTEKKEWRCLCWYIKECMKRRMRLRYL